MHIDLHQLLTVLNGTLVAVYWCCINEATHDLATTETINVVYFGDLLKGSCSLLHIM